MLLHRLSKAYSNLCTFMCMHNAQNIFQQITWQLLLGTQHRKNGIPAFNLIQATSYSFADHRLPEDQSQLHIFFVFHNLLHC